MVNGLHCILCFPSVDVTFLAMVDGLMRHRHSKAPELENFKPLVVRSEVVSPLRNTMGFIHRHPSLCTKQVLTSIVASPSEA